ncbi:MAG TPA: hypothetical protein VEC06_08600 [Paucimonas sp.]|nr:hypothetical protein [Paucimonas sp.]
MSELTKHLYEAVGRHFVSLSCVQWIPDERREQICLFSGFLADISGIWFYITAGHNLKAIAKGLDAGYTFNTWRLDDSTAGHKFDQGIPIDFNLDHWLVIENEDEGLDYAALPLHILYARQLEVGGATPIAHIAWGDHVMDHDHWALVGVPYETVTYSDQNFIRARNVFAPLKPAGEPEAAGTKAQNQFYAKLQDDPKGVVANIGGMSGGPIFAFKKVESEWRYSVIGVQSGWYKESRTIAACPFSTFALELQRLVETARNTAD